MKVKAEAVKLIWVATVEVENSGIFREILRFKDPLGRTVRVAVASSLMGKAKELAGLLADLGWQTLDQSAAVGAVQALSSKRPPTNGVLLITNGWWGENNDVFRCGTHVSTSRKAILFYIPTETGRADPEASGSRVKFVRYESPTALTTRLASRGTLKSWRQEVGKRALKSSRVMTAICATFAAPLLKILEIRPFGIVVFGGTRDGKTTTEIATASVIGIGTEQGLPKWALTEAALQEICRMFNDLVLPLDDIALVKGNSKAKYQVVQDMAYRFSIGGQVQISTRGMRALGELPMRTEGYRSIIVTSSEKAIYELAEEAGVERMGGEALRLIDLPASRQGSAGVWDRLAAGDLAGDLLKLGSELSEELKTACRDNHGAVIGRFLESFLGNKKEAISAAKKAIVTFKKLAGSEDHDKQAQGMVEAFAALYAGGSLAVKFNVVPWNRKELRDAVLTCCRDAIAVLNRKPTAAIDPLKPLWAILTDESLVPSVADSKAHLLVPAIGRKLNKRGAFVVEILSGKLKEHAAAGAIHQRLIEHLDTDRVLQRDSAGNPAHNIRWPGSKNKVRAHRLAWPSKVAFDDWLCRSLPVPVEVNTRMAGEGSISEVAV